jgi:hypothetical protein
MLTGSGGSMGGVAGTTGSGPLATVGPEMGADVVGGDGIGCKSGCFELSETMTTDATSATTNSMNKAPPTITGADDHRRSTIEPTSSAASARDAASTSVPGATRQSGDVIASPSEQTLTGSRTSAIFARR